MKHCLLLIISLCFASTVVGADKTAKPSGRVQVAAKTLAPAQRTKLLEILNSGDDVTLMSLPHIGQTRALAIMKARPIINLVDLVKVEGIGDQTFVDIIVHAKAGFPETEPACSKKSMPFCS